MELVQVIAGESSRKKSRWVRSTYKPSTANKFSKSKERAFLPPTFVDLPRGLSSEEIVQFYQEQRVDELARRLRANALELGDPDIRPPSPPPRYDQNGVRVNSREQRVRKTMEDEFARINRFLSRRIPGYVPPLDLYKSAKIVKKVEIPVSDFPDINFVAVIVGPRGINHKRLQDESRCRIEFRGQNSSSTNQSFEESDMPLHVHIEGDTDQDIDLAVSMVSALLDPTSAEFKMNRADTAETLAAIGGNTVKCGICQSTSHTSVNCPDATAGETASMVIRCTICGGKGHLTSDCPQRLGGLDGADRSVPSVDTAKVPIAPIQIPTTVIGAFIGVQGANIKRLMVETGCNIQVDQSRVAQGVTECPLVFTGPPDAVVRARQACTEWLDSHQKSRDTQSFQRQLSGMSGFTDPEHAAQAVQMAYYQQLMWQSWYAQYGGQPPNGSAPPPFVMPPGPAYPPAPPGPN